MSAQAARFRTLSFMATADVPSGSHDVSLDCSRFDRSDLQINTPIAAGRRRLTGGGVAKEAAL